MPNKDKDKYKDKDKIRGSSKYKHAQKHNKLFIGIDPSLTSTGYVCLDKYGSVIRWGVVKTAPKLLKSNSGEVKRLIHIEETLSRLISELASADAEVSIGYEHYSYGSQNKPFKLGELGGVLKTAFFRHGWNQLHIAPSVIKKFATGNGQASKYEVQQQAIRESSPQFLNDLPSDVYDAYFLAKFSWYFNEPQAAIDCESDAGRDMVRDRLELCMNSFTEKE